MFRIWLKRQLSTLEAEIRDSAVFESAEPATPQQIHDLRRKITIYRFLQQQHDCSDRCSPTRRYETAERPLLETVNA